MKLQAGIAVAFGASMALVSASPCKPQPLAVIYRGPAACDTCPERVGQILRNSPMKFRVVYAGPNEDVQPTKETLKNAAVYVQPGGGDLKPGWKHMKPYANAIRDYVGSGGRYLGFCLGAYLAGHHQGFGILPPGQKDGGAIDEIYQDGAEVQGDEDTVIKVNWSFHSGPKAGKTEKGRYLYFQDGATMNLPKWDNITILGTYSANNNVAAAISPYGKGWVGTVGPHPEADKTWYDLGFKNPEGIKTDIVEDFCMSTLQKK